MLTYHNHLVNVLCSAEQPRKVVCLTQQLHSQHGQFQPRSHLLLELSFTNSSQDALPDRRAGVVREDLEAEVHFSLQFHSSKKSN